MQKKFVFSIYSFLLLHKHNKQTLNERTNAREDDKGDDDDGKKKSKNSRRWVR
jgi:hypothetical protein